MARGRRHSPWRSWRHRIITGVALFAYLAAAVGYPLPAAPAGRKDLSQRFPCEGHACGCRSAEECWSGCCCMTPEERWAWARAHGVQPPDYAEKPSAAPGWRTVRLRDQAENHEPTCGACCAHGHASQASCCSKPRSPRPSCCAHSNPQGDNHSVTGTDAKSSGDWVLGVSALRCKGLSLLWVDGGVVVPATGPAGQGFYRTAPERTALDNDEPVRIGKTPPAPPPKQLSA
jgi:hypothetical protein